METHKTEWYHSIFITYDPKLMGPTKKNLVWLSFWMMFSSLKTQKFEWEWWKLKTENGSFQNFKLSFQWHIGKQNDFVRPIDSVLLHQIEDLILPLLFTSALPQVFSQSKVFLFPTFFFTSSALPQNFHITFLYSSSPFPTVHVQKV